VTLCALHASALIGAPVEVVFDWARDAGSFRLAGWRPMPPGVTHGLLDRGDQLRLAGSGRIRAARVVVCDRPRALQLQSSGRSPLTYRETFAVTGAGTLVTATLQLPAPAGPGGRRRGLRWLAGRTAALRAAGERPPRLVVAAAIVSDARLLVGSRVEEVIGSGRWELPGGKVRPGEPPRVALVRECREELDVGIAVGEAVGTDVPMGVGDSTLRVWSARITAGTPTALGHSELRWITADELSGLDWLPADRALIPHLRRLLRTG